jgi:serine/threonine-protein kinase
MGKLSYAAPEQAEGKPFDLRVDLFAVGVIFYELLTGAHPFGKVSDIEALIESRKKAVVPPSKCAGLPKVFDDFVARSLAYDPSQRFQTAEEMADELLQMLFPTQTMEVMAHLEATMRELYRGNIERQQRERAKDSAHMRALAESSSKAGRPSNRKEDPLQQALEAIPTAAGTKIFVSKLEEAKPTVSLTPRPVPPQTPPRPKARPQPARRSGRTAAFLAGALVGAAAGLAAAFVHLESSPKPLVVLSEPIGAEVFFGERSLGRTPLFLKQPEVPEHATLELRLAQHRSAQAPIERSGRVLVARAKLETALGKLRIESVPPGATVRMNGRVIGTTPVEVGDLAVDTRHRFDLERPGYLLDSFVVRPEEVEGGVVRRTLRRE